MKNEEWAAHNLRLSYSSFFILHSSFNILHSSFNLFQEDIGRIRFWPWVGPVGEVVQG